MISYDFDGNGIITRADIRIILAYIPQHSSSLRTMEMRNENEDTIKKHMFENRLKTMEQIEQLLDMIFQDRAELQYDDFSHIIQNESSDLLVNMLQVIRDCMPCT